MKELPRICCSCERRTFVPLIVFMRIRIIADPSNYKTGEVVHQATSFHLKAQDIQFWILSILVPFLCIFHNRVGGCDDAIMDNDFSTGFARCTLVQPISTAFRAVLSILMSVVGAIQSIF